MDFKGITWAGNIYQKFEAMCLEVEKVMYQDTVMYVENQVQKAGVSVKKFYSEVMQDLLPSSCVDPVKVAANDLSLYPYAYTDINKIKLSMSENWGEVKNKATEDRVITDMDARKKYPLSGLGDANYLSPQSSGVPVQNTSSKLYTAKGKNVGVYKHPVIGITRISQNYHPPKISGPVSAKKSRISTLCDMRGNCAVTSDHMKSALDSPERCDPGEAVITNTQISDALVDSPVSNTILSIDPIRQKEEDAQCISSCHGFPSESIGASVSGGAVSQLESDINTYDIVSSCEEVIMSDKDNIDMEVIENEELVELGVNIIKQVEKSTLEGTCVLVEADELHGVPQATRKNKSYKKKIREALSSKLRSPKKQEDKCSDQYERVGGNGEIVIPALTMDLEKTKLPSHDFSESDWEFL